jgi:hypothetical protein
MAGPKRKVLIAGYRRTHFFYNNRVKTFRYDFIILSVFILGAIYDERETFFLNR